MFCNSVFRPSVNTMEWLKATGIRAGKTMAQTALSMLTIGQAIMDVNWFDLISVSVVAGLVSVLTSIAGLPEVRNEEREEKAE